MLFKNFELELKRDERVMRFLTTKMNKDHFEYAEKEELSSLRLLKLLTFKNYLMADNSEIRYLNQIDIEIKKSKYCRFKKSGIKFIDYKDPDFLMKFINEQGKLLPEELLEHLQNTRRKFLKQ